MKKYLVEDIKAKSQSFFLKKTFYAARNGFSKFLIAQSKKTKKDVRICMHSKKQDKHHDMIILLQKKNFYYPHKHLKKTETYHVIKGKMACILFKKNGTKDKVCLLKKNDVIRMPFNTFHATVPLSQKVIFHESKNGPFLKKNDSIFPKWAKKFKSKKERELFKAQINKIAKNF